ncbi:MAG: hypothetical protein Q7R74_02025 [bacterium]|nr:hypothetical protein [bacterium]
MTTTTAETEGNTADSVASAENHTSENEPSEEKLLPPGTPHGEKRQEPEPVTPLQRAAADMLHMGNVVIASQSSLRPKSDASTDIEKGADAENLEMPLERNLREVGLKEALPRSGKEPPRPQALSEFESHEGTPRIRTYAADMSQEIKKRGVTLSSIITAEKAHAGNANPAPVPQSRRRWLFLGGAAILLVLGIGATVTALLFSGSQKGTTSLPTSLIPINHRVNVSSDGTEPLSQTLAEIRTSADMNLGEIEEIDIMKDGVLLTSEKLLTTLGAPNELARNAIGILVGVHAFDGNQPFVLISVSDYGRAFQAMLSWEETMSDDLGLFFAPKNINPGSVIVRPPPSSFIDRVAANLDVRESQKEWPILYAFPGQDLLLLTTNESTLREILTRLSLQNSSAD